MLSKRLQIIVISILAVSIIVNVVTIAENKGYEEYLDPKLRTMINQVSWGSLISERILKDIVENKSISYDQSNALIDKYRIFRIGYSDIRGLAEGSKKLHFDSTIEVNTINLGRRRIGDLDIHNMIGEYISDFHRTNFEGKKEGVIELKDADYKRFKALYEIMQETSETVKKNIRRFSMASVEPKKYDVRGEMKTIYTYSIGNKKYVDSIFQNWDNDWNINKGRWIDLVKDLKTIEKVKKHQRIFSDK